MCVVEVLDIIPTLLDLLDIRRIPVLCPAGRLCPELEGKSLAPAIRGGPDDSIGGIDYALSQLRRCPYAKTDKPRSKHIDDKWDAICHRRNRDKGSVMGYSIRVKDWRYTAWFQYDEATKRPLISLPLVTEELYSHENEGVHEFDTELQNLMKCEQGQCSCINEEIEPIRYELKNNIYRILTKRMSFNIKEALNKTRSIYSKTYEIRNDRAFKIIATGERVFIEKQLSIQKSKNLV